MSGDMNFYRNIIDDFTRREKEWSIKPCHYPILIMKLSGSRNHVYKGIKSYMTPSEDTDNQVRLCHVSLAHKGSSDDHIITLVLESSKESRPIIDTFLRVGVDIMESIYAYSGDVKLLSTSALQLDHEMRVLIYLNTRIYNHMRRVASNVLKKPSEDLKDIITGNDWSGLTSKIKYGSIFTVVTGDLEEKHEVINMEKIDKAISTYLVKREAKTK